MLLLQDHHALQISNNAFADHKVRGSVAETMSLRQYYELKQRARPRIADARPRIIEVSNLEIDPGAGRFEPFNCFIRMRLLPPRATGDLSTAFPGLHPCPELTEIFASAEGRPSPAYGVGS